MAAVRWEPLAVTRGLATLKAVMWANALCPIARQSSPAVLAPPDLFVLAVNAPYRLVARVTLKEVVVPI